MEQRRFDYNIVSEIYKEMQNITGVRGDGNSIAGILSEMDETFRNKVDVIDEAIYGELGKQLLLDWDNTSSDFPKFVDNFETWCSVIAKVSEDYANLEEKYKGFADAVETTRAENPFGMSAEAGMTGAYTHTGYYSTYDESYIATAAEKVDEFRALTGTIYLNTNMVAREEARKTSAKWAFGIQTVSTILSLISIGKVVSTAAKGAEVALEGADDVVEAVVANTADDALGAAAKLGAESIDDLVAKAASMSQIDKVNFVKALVKDGTIQSMDDLVKFFGSEAAAKSALSGKVFNSFATAFANGGDDLANLVVSNLDDAASAITKMNTKEAQAFVQRLIDTGKISSVDDLLKVCGGESAAKMIFGSASNYRAVVDGIAASSEALANAAGTIGADATIVAAHGGETLMSRAAANIAGMSDDALAKVLGLSDEAVDAIILDGGTVRQYAMEALKDSNMVTKFASAGSGIAGTVSNVYQAAVGKINLLSDGAIQKILGLSDDMVDAIILDGGTVKGYALSLLGDSGIAQAFANAPVGNIVLAGGAVAAGQYGEGWILGDIDYGNVTYTMNPYDY